MAHANLVPSTHPPADGPALAHLPALMIRPPSEITVPGKRPKRAERQERSQIESELGRREVNRRDKLTRISEAARTLFRRKGFDATTTQEVAERAGIASGTLFLYAETKEDLLLLAFLGEILDVLEHIRASMPVRATLTEQVLHLFEGMFAYHAEDIDLTRHLMRELAFVRNPQRRAEVGQLAEKVFDSLQSMIEPAQRQGKVDPGLNARAAATDLFALYFSHLSGWSNGFITRDDYVRGLRRSVAHMIKGLAPQAGKPR